MLTSQTNLNAARNQQMINQGKQQNPGHYVQKQKEAQIVRIKSIEPVVQVALPGLVPDFQNISEALGSNSNDVFYQLKSFRCSNRFQNIFDKDRIHLTTLVVYKPIAELLDGNFSDDIQALNPLTVAGDDNEPTIVKLEPYNSGHNIRSGAEIVDMLNRAVNQKVLPYPARFSGDINTIPAISSSNDMNLANLFDLGRFTLKNSKLNFLYDYTLSESAKPGSARLLPFFFEPNTQERQASGEHFISEAYIKVSTDPKMLYEDQLRIAKLLGMSRRNEDGSFCLEIYLERYFIERAIMAMNRQNVSYDRFIPTIQNNVIEARSYGSIMNVYPYDSIIIRSSLQSNIWDEKGKKTNIIGVIPLTGGIDTIAMEYTPQSGTNRTYNIRDSLNSIQNFIIEFTDELGNRITFEDEYELEIAVFFTHKDPIMLTF